MAKEYTLGESLALSIAGEHGQIDGGHHKAWVIDQMCRKILGDDYETFIKNRKAVELGPNTYEWDTGIAP